MLEDFHNDDDDDNADDAKAIVIPQVFSENSQAKNVSFALQKQGLMHLKNVSALVDLGCKFSVKLSECEMNSLPHDI